MMKNKFQILSLLVLIAVFILSAFVKCKEQSIKQNENNKLQLLNKILLKLPEPSGITFNKKDKTLYVVSDEFSKIYKLLTNGKITDSISVNGFDLEGVTCINDTTLATILERNRTVVTLTTSGKELSRFNLDLYGKPNKGIEGIAFNPNNNHIYVLNEKKPGLLLEVELNGKLISKKKLNFAKDYSGLFFDEIKNELWITSHENKSIYKCTTDGTVLNSFFVDVQQLEGVAINFVTKKIYLICDKTHTLFIYLLP